MKNKKGFTLVELLGAMVVLALLSLLTIPVVTNVVKENKQKLYDTQIKNIESAAAAWSSDNLSMLPEKGASITVSLKKLQEEGYVEKNIKNPKTGEKLENVDIYIRNIGKQYIYNVGEDPFDVLLKGSQFKSKLIELANDSSWGTQNIKIIEFYSNDELPNGYTKSKLEKLDNISVSKNNKVKAYYDSKNKTVYIHSKYQINANEDSSNMFSSLIYLTNINNLTELDTSNVTNMSSMFAGESGISSLKTLDLSSFDTSNVTNMSSMFSECSSLKNLDLSSFDTSNVTDMSSMFSECSGLKNLDLSSFDTSNVTKMSYMFYNTNNLTSIELSNFKGHGSPYMFCSSGIKSLDLSKFEFSGYDSSYMFAYNKLDSIIWPDFSVESFCSSGANTTGMFSNGKYVKEIPFSCAGDIK